MSKRLKSKYSVCKKLNFVYKNIWGFEKKNFSRSLLINKRKKSSFFGKLLNIKQSLKFFYSNISESSFKNYISFSTKSPAKTIDKLVSILESRLDTSIFRSCFVSSFYEARQLINHKFVFVNGECVTLVDKKLYAGDLVEIRIQKNLNKNFYNVLLTRSLPSNLELDFKNKVFIFLWDTDLKNVYYPIKVDYSAISRYY